MWSSRDSPTHRNSSIANHNHSLFGHRLEQSVPSSNDQDDFIVNTRAQLLWGENALLCGNFDEASRCFLGVIDSFEHAQNLDFKDQTTSATHPTSPTISVTVGGECRSIQGTAPQESASDSQQSQQTYQYQQQEHHHQQHATLQQHEQRTCYRRQEQLVTLLGSALYGLGTTYMLQGQFDHAQPALRRAVQLYWRVHGEGSPLLELARIQLHRLYCYWGMAQHQQREQQQMQIDQQPAWRQTTPTSNQLSSMDHPHQDQEELADAERYRLSGNLDDLEEGVEDDEYETEDDDEQEDRGVETDENIGSEIDEQHCCYCPGEICQMFSRAVRHAAAA